MLPRPQKANFKNLALRISEDRIVLESSKFHALY